MKKLQLLLLVIALFWLALLSYFVWVNVQQQQILRSDLHQSQQKNASLNDQLVALQRDNPTHQTAAMVTAVELNHAIDPMQVLKDHVDYIEFALAQQQTEQALSRLNVLAQQLPSYPLSAPLKQSWLQVIAQDRQSIEKFILLRIQQQQHIQTVLQQFDQMLLNSTQATQLHSNVAEQTAWWQGWFKLERSDNVGMYLQQRPLILKEAQLRLLLARGILLRGDYAQYHQEVNQILQLIAKLPDQDSQKLLAALQKIQHMELISVPKLAMRSLLGA